MIKSMTGFGKATVESGDRKIIVEVKSLNSKQVDISLRMPNLYKEKEMEIRNIIKNFLERGKIDMTIYFDNADTDKDVSVNQSVVEQYFKQMLDVASSLGVETNNNEILQTVMRFPETLKQKTEELDEGEWERLKTGIEKALEQIDQFRIQEGRVLIKDILHRIDLIQEFASEVPQYEGRRIEGVRQRLLEKMKEWNEIQNIDQNRLEQEIIYYLEKLDITEEKVRLTNHCKYFIETAEKEEAPGRKLGFIAQEIGREINTMGSKANDHDIQKLVVRMKDELEKIKEQSFNIL
ncbi:MAG: YicC family protein [Odoribacter sp.]|nr:YicC family protein [Odoribacter sp.]